MAEGNAEEVSNACVRHENGRAQRGSPEAGLLGPSPTASARAPGPFRAAPVQAARAGSALAVCREQVRAHELRGREHVDGRFAAQARDDDRANRLYSDAVVLNPAVLQRAPAPRDDGCSWPEADVQGVGTSVGAIASLGAAASPVRQCPERRLERSMQPRFKFHEALHAVFVACRAAHSSRSLKYCLEQRNGSAQLLRAGS